MKVEQEQKATQDRYAKMKADEEEARKEYQRMRQQEIDQLKVMD